VTESPVLGRSREHFADLEQSSLRNDNFWEADLIERNPPPRGSFLFTMFPDPGGGFLRSDSCFQVPSV